MGESF